MAEIGLMRRDKVTKKDVEIYKTIVDDVDYDLGIYRRGCDIDSRGTLRARRSIRERGSSSSKPVYLSISILERKLGRGINEGYVCDHIDGNTLNNSRSNLREVTYKENCENRKKKKGTSIYLGVFCHKCFDKWVSQIRQNGIQYYLGIYNEEKEVAIAYDIAVLNMHSEYSSTNFCRSNYYKDSSGFWCCKESVETSKEVYRRFKKSGLL